MLKCHPRCFFARCFSICTLCIFALLQVVFLSPARVAATLISFEQKLTSDVVADKGFGVAVATDGVRLVIGASPLMNFPREENPRERVYVFIRGETGWEFEQKLQPDDFSSEEGFGYSVAISGNMIVVGAPFKNDPVGAVYTFIHNGTEWVRGSGLPSFTVEGDRSIGFSVALSGNTLLVGAPFAETVGASTGRAWVYVWDGNFWLIQKTLLPESMTEEVRFGQSVALSGNTAVVGAPSENDFIGSVSIFVRSGTAWELQQKLLPELPSDTPNFGWSVAIDTDTAVVGAPGGGFASVYTRSGTTWTRQQRLDYTSDPFGGSGWSVAVLGNIVVIGAPSDHRGTTAFIGSVDVYVRRETTWYFQQTLLSDVVDDPAFFGGSVAIGGESILIGALVETIGGTFGLGSARVFHIDDPEIKAEFESPPNGAVAGVSLVRGWGFDSRAGDTLSTVDLYIDGERETSIACCSERKDVQTAFPEYPALNTLNSGWGLTFNWGNLPAGLHTARVDLESTSGATLSTVERAINVVKLGDFPFLDLFDLATATGDAIGQDLVLTGVRVRDKDSQEEKIVEATFQWERAAQGFQLTDSMIVAQLIPPPTMMAMFASWWQTFRRWFGKTSLTPSAFANPDLMHVFESPANGPVSGVALVRGWAFETEAEEGIASVELFIDGQPNTTIACCSEREDVQAAFPQFPAANTLNSGWGLTLNWGDLSAGEHQVQVLLESTTSASMLSDARTVTVIKPGGFSFLDSLDISAATTMRDGQDIVLSGVLVTDAASETIATITLRLRWDPASQTLTIISATPVS